MFSISFRKHRNEKEEKNLLTLIIKIIKIIIRLSGSHVMAQIGAWQPIRSALSWRHRPQHRDHHLALCEKSVWTERSRDWTYGLTSLSEKTRMSNHLQMLEQRQNLLSYFKTLSVGPAGNRTRASRRADWRLKPGFHIIVQVAPIVSIFSDISETTGTTQTTGTGLWFPYNRFVRLPRGCLVEVLNPSTIFWCENHFWNGTGKCNSEPCCILIACCWYFTEEKRKKRATKA